MATCVPPAFAQQSTEMVIQPELQRKGINEAKIDTENWELGVYGGMLSIEDFGVNAVTGARGAYHINQDFFVEAAYGRSTAGRTSYESLSGSVELLTDAQRKLSYYNVSLAYSLLPGEVFVRHRYAFNTDLYVIAGFGSTKFGDDDHYTVNAGAGFRIVLNDWLALRADFRDHMFDSDLLGSSNTMHNFEAAVGATVFF